MTGRPVMATADEMKDCLKKLTYLKGSTFNQQDVISAVEAVHVEKSKARGVILVGEAAKMSRNSRANYMSLAVAQPGIVATQCWQQKTNTRFTAATDSAEIWVQNRYYCKKIPVF
jgi:hypothetical protein